MNLGFKIAKGRTIFLLFLLQMVLETISFDFASRTLLFKFRSVHLVAGK